MTPDELDPPDTRAQHALEEPADLRVSTLREAAEASAASAASARGHQNGWRWGLRAGGGVALVALLAVVAVAISPLIPRPAPPKPPPKPLAAIALQVPGGVSGAFSGEAWSPDGRFIALTLDSSSDPGANTNPNDSTLLIFDSHTGALINGFPLDRMVLPPNTPTGSLVAPGGVIWTADGLRIAVPFTVEEPDVSGVLSPAAGGLALLTVRGAYLGAIQVSSDTPPPQAGVDPLARNTAQDVTVWDVGDGLTSLKSQTPPDSLAYRWTDGGTLAAIPASSAQGDLSLWRDGELNLVNAFVCAGDTGKPQPHPYLELSLSTLAWSPGGQYLTSLSAARRYEIPAGSGPTPAPGSAIMTGACNAGPAYDSLEPGPRHDAGLSAAETLAASPDNPWVGLEWSPNGQRLAAFPFNITGAGAILVYDCHTGKLVARVAASQVAISGQPGTGPAKNFNTVFTGGAWSPDGRSLLVEAEGVGARPIVLEPAALGG